MTDTPPVSPSMSDTPPASPSIAGSPPKPPRRRRGAPLHNRNALKHGFYARKYRPSDLEDLADSKFTGLNQEMDLMRVFMRSVVEQAVISPTYCLSESIETLHALSLGAASLTRMAKTQKYLNDNPDGDSALSQAIHEVLKDWKETEG